MFGNCSHNRQTPRSLGQTLPATVVPTPSPDAFQCGTGEVVGVLLLLVFQGADAWQRLPFEKC